MQSVSHTHRPLTLLALIFCLLAAGIMASGYFYFERQKENILNDKRENLRAIAEMKAAQIEHWRQECMDDGERLGLNAALARQARRYFLGRGSAEDEKDLRQWLETISARGCFDRAALVDASEGVRLASEPGKPPMGREARALIHQVLAERRTMMSALHGSRLQVGTIHMDLVSPLLLSQGVQSEAVGALVGRVDPRRYLYPLIQTWPSPSQTAETLLVTRQGDYVVYLNDLRHRQGTALTLRFPLRESLDTVAVQAAYGRDGVYEGMDYRGISVLSAVKAVRGSPWLVVAKIDAQEVYAPIQDRALGVVLSVIAFLAAAGAGVGLWWRHERALYYQGQYEAEHKLRGVMQRYESLTRFAHDMILILHPDGQILEVNDSAVAAYGYSKEDLYRLKIHDLRSPDSSTEAGEQFSRERTSEGAVFETKHRRSDGTTFPVEVSARLIKVGEEDVILSVIRDISQRRNLEEKLRQAQKMESVGRLAGGVAHDFNNLLTIITGYGAMLLGRLDREDPSRNLVEQINKAGERAADLTQQLLAFSRKQVMRPGPLDLNAVVSEHETMLRRLVREDVELVTRLSPSLGLVMADAGQIHQVLMNLVGNARDALPSGGTVTIETAQVYVDDREVTGRPDIPAGSYVLLKITDNGIGMDEQTRQQIFEPFFTTKNVGAGTGLGLSTVHGIVTQSGGWIFVDSKPGHGTSFRVYLSTIPLVAHVHTAGKVAGPAARGSETILIVEDQEQLLELAALVLKSQGYQVLVASNGNDALVVADRYIATIDLLLTDMVMPGMTGRKLADHLKLRRPGIRVLFMSGYRGEGIARPGELETDYPFLPKPFTPDKLTKKVREVLD